MAATAAITARNNRLFAPLLSIVGSVIVSAGFFYPCLFVVLSESCHARFCHFGIVHRGIFSGWQILAINAHPAAAPFIMLIVAPPSLVSLVPLAMGGVALFLSVTALLRQPPRWVLWMTLGIVGLGLLILIYDTALLSGGGGVYDNGYVATTTISPLALAGHASLYCGYLLLLLGVGQMLRRKNQLSGLLSG